MSEKNKRSVSLVVLVQENLPLSKQFLGCVNLKLIQFTKLVNVMH
jgi:hypothetical protein